MGIGMLIWAVAFGVFESVWRRTHGGGPLKKLYDKYVKPILFGLNYRIVSVALNSAAVFSVGLFARHLEWWQSALFAAIVWAFWDISFGMYMGIGNHPYPSHEDKEEYKRQYPVVWILKFVFKDDRDPMWGRYGVAYDFCGMWIRFTYPLIPLLLLPTFTPWMMTLGLVVAVCYLLDVWVFDWWDAEYSSGFFAGLAFVLL